MRKREEKGDYQDSDSILLQNLASAGNDANIRPPTSGTFFSVF